MFGRVFIKKEDKMKARELIEKDVMYKGMKLNQEYTLEDLDL